MRKLSLLAALALGIGAVGPLQSVAVDGDTATLTIASTTDLHGYMLNWDYFRDAPYSDRSGHEIGLAQAASAIEELRDARGAESVIVVDNGDFLQGSPLDTYYATQAPITETGDEHAVAAAFDAVGYDVGNLGNHEFNYGLDYLAAFEGQIDHPLLGANVLDADTGEPLFDPYTLVTRQLGDAEVTVGFLGLTTPGSMIWDAKHLEGNVVIEDMVDAAQRWVPEVREAGADIVVVLSHSGLSGSSYANAGLPPENQSQAIAEQVPGIDAMVIGHSHRDEPIQWLTNASTGDQVAVTQPRFWGSGITDMTFDLVQADGRWTVESVDAAPLYAKDYEPSQAVVDAVAAGHADTVEWVNTKIATSVSELPATESRYRDTAIIDYIQMVQAETVRAALAGGEYADLPVLSIAAPFSRTAVFPEGDVTVRDMAALYIYDNTLEGVLMTGAQVRDFLEFSAKYYAQVEPGEAFDPETMTGVEYNGQTIPDYLYDIIAGINYEIDLSQPVGSRIENLQYVDGTPVGDDDQFVVAVNNYRRSGGGGFPHISEVPVVYNDLVEIRQVLIDWAIEHGTIDGEDFFVRNWRLTIADEPVFADDILFTTGDGATPTPSPTPSPSPTPTPVPGRPGLPSTGN